MSFIMLNWTVVIEKLVLIVVLGLVIYGIITFLITTFGKQHDSALQILKERYARGEITVEEFEEGRHVLKK